MNGLEQRGHEMEADPCTLVSAFTKQFLSPCGGLMAPALCVPAAVHGDAGGGLRSHLPPGGRRPRLPGRSRSAHHAVAADLHLRGRD